MSDPLTEVVDIEAPEADAVEQAQPVDGPPGADDQILPPDLLSGDLEVPEPDAIEQHLPAPDPFDEDWR